MHPILLVAEDVYFKCPNNPNGRVVIFVEIDPIRELLVYAEMIVPLEFKINLYLLKTLLETLPSKMLDSTEVFTDTK